MAQHSWSPEQSRSQRGEGEIATRIPTRYLGGVPDSRYHRRSGLSGPITRIPRSATLVETSPNASYPNLHDTEQQAVVRRRRLLSIFGRMMARFYEQHERRWSMGRWECQLCQRRIVAWAWAPLADSTAVMHEACVNRSMWDVVIYYERLAQAGYAQDLNNLRFSIAP
jgi:ribosomal protein L37AE/L43A